MNPGQMEIQHLLIHNKFVTICNISQTTVLPFPTTYLVECAFSAVSDFLCDKRSNLDISERGDLRAKLTNFKPRFANIASQHQAQGSH